MPLIKVSYLLDIHWLLHVGVTLSLDEKHTPRTGVPSPAILFIYDVCLLLNLYVLMWPCISKAKGDLRCPGCFSTAYVRGASAGASRDSPVWLPGGVLENKLTVEIWTLCKL